MSTTRRVHVALMGIEKVIPRLSDLAVFLKLLRIQYGPADGLVHLAD